MPALAFSVVDALEVIGLGAAGFILVALVCAAVLAMLHLVLPAADSGATELDRLHSPAVDEAPEADQEEHRLDTEAKA